MACDIVGLSRSSYYYQAVEQDESKLENAIEEIAGQFPTYGTRRVAQQLRRAPYEMTVNHKRARRIAVGIPCGNDHQEAAQTRKKAQTSNKR